MATLREIREQYPQYDDLSNRELLDGMHSKFYSDIPKETFYSKVLGSPEAVVKEQPEFSEFLGVKYQPNVLKQQLTGATRDIAGLTPLVGGYADEAEAAIRSLSGPETREEELAKIRQEQSQYEDVLERTGAAPYRTAGQIGGGIAASIPVFGGLAKGIGALGSGASKLAPAAQKAQQFASTKLGQSALGAALGGVEAAGFADEDAVTGGGLGAAIGGAVPVVGRGLARALGKTTKFAGKPIEKIASTDEGVSSIIKGIDASPKLASEIRPLAQKGLEETESRVQKTILDELKIKKIEDIAKPAKLEYSNFITENSDKTIPVNKVLPLYRKANVKTLANKLRADNPDTLGKMPLNSVGFLQELKSTASARGRSGSENAKEWAQAGRSIKQSIDDNFSGFKELNTKFAKAVEADKLVDKISNLNLQEDSNVAKSILKGQNKRDLYKSFGKEKTNNLINSLRKEVDVRDSLKSIASKSRNRAQDRGSLNVLLGGGGVGPAIGRGAAYVGAGSIHPALGAGLVGSDIAAGAIKRRGATKAARELLQGGTKAEVNELANVLATQQLSRQAGGQ